MNWTEIINEAQEQEILANSHKNPVLIFKHSPRCSISNMAKTRVEKMQDTDMPCYLLNVITHRPVSMKIADHYQVHHESPQALIIVKGECVYDESHNGITAHELSDELNEWQKKMAAGTV